MSERDIVERLRADFGRDLSDSPPYLCKVAADTITALRARLSSAEAERDRLREGLVAIRDGDVPRQVGTRFRSDGKPSKLDICVHEIMLHDECAECVSAAARALLTPQAETR